MQSRPNILHVFPSFEIGGAQRRTATLLNEGLKGFDHTIIALDGNFEAKALFNPASTNITFAEHIIFPKTGILKASLNARKLLKSIRPDLMVTYNWGSIEWALANRFNALCQMIHIQDGFACDEQNQENKKRRWLRRFAYQTCRRVIVPSQLLYTIAEHSWRVETGRLHYIPNGIHIERFQNTADQNLLETLQINPNDFIIGTVAALRPEKNLSALITAFDQFLKITEAEHTFASSPQTSKKLVIIGDGAERPKLEHLANQYGLKDQVIFTGTIEQPERILPAFDIFTLSSMTEQMPISVIEAMATGLPIVATDVGDIKTMVAGENRPLIADKTPETLAQNFAMLFKASQTLLKDAEAVNHKSIPEDTLLNTSKTMDAIGKANHIKAKDLYTVDAMIKAYDDTVRTAIEP